VFFFKNKNNKILKKNLKAKKILKNKKLWNFYENIPKKFKKYGKD